MENDAIRGSGSNTLVDIWIDGKIRAISVSRKAIEAFLGHEAAAKLTEDDRCEFVRKHLPLVIAAAKATLTDGDPGADTIRIDGTHFHRPGAARSGDRRKTDRRKAERRKEDRPVPVNRRRGDRRKGERRGSPKPTDSKRS